MRTTTHWAQRLIAWGYLSLTLCPIALALAYSGMLDGLTTEATGSASLRSIAGLGVLGCLLAAAGHAILERELQNNHRPVPNDHQQP
jgi:hypothetical protein